MGLHRLLTTRREELLERWAARAKASFVGRLTNVELIDRMPRFVDELVRALANEAPPPEGSPNAEEHGVQRLRLGFDVGEVVREYGQLHVAILELAAEAKVTIDDREGQILAESLSKGTADAVTQYQWQRDTELQRQSAEHLAFIAHELRNPLGNAQMAYALVKRQADGVPATERLGRALTRLAGMIDNALSHAWLQGGAPIRGERVELPALVAQIAEDLAGEAEAKGIEIIQKLEPIVIQADPRLLSSAISNLVRNAIKFGKRELPVVIRAWQNEGRVLIEVEDGCGGLPPGKSEELFSPFVQKGTNRSGFGLGLAIARQAAESHNGTLKVRNLPDHGCVFVLDLPKTGGPPAPSA